MSSCSNCGACTGAHTACDANRRSCCGNQEYWNNGCWNNWNNWCNCNNWNTRDWENWNTWMQYNWNYRNSRNACGYQNTCQSTQLLDGASCGRYIQPIASAQAQFSNAGVTNGATLVIHKIVLEPCGNQSCTPRTFNIRITGPSYPHGEVFQLHAGNCLELDEPLVITGLEPGTYCIEELYNCSNEYISTFTGPVCGHQVTVSNSWFPTVITIVSRKRLCRLCHNCGCGTCSACG